MKTLTRNTPRVLLIVALAASALIGTARDANADVVYDASGRLVLRPHKVYVGTGGTVVVEPDPSVVPVYIQPRPSIMVLSARRDPYATKGLVIAGGGVGGLLLRANGKTALLPTYRLHLGLAVGQAQIGLRANLAPHAMTLPETTDAAANDVALYATRLTFDYRFLKDAVVHPVAGAGLEALIADPAAGGTGFTLAGTARIGLEFAFPIGESALAVGLDATGHLPMAKSEKMVLDLAAMLSFGAYLDFRF